MKSHWAWSSLDSSRQFPEVDRIAIGRLNSVDHFILAKLERCKVVAGGSEADRRSLVTTALFRPDRIATVACMTSLAVC